MLKLALFVLVCSVIITASVSMDASNAKIGYLSLRKRTAESADETSDIHISETEAATRSRGLPRKGRYIHFKDKDWRNAGWVIRKD